MVPHETELWEVMNTIWTGWLEGSIVSSAKWGKRKNTEGHYESCAVGHHTELCCEFPEVSEIENKTKHPKANRKIWVPATIEVIIHWTVFHFSLVLSFFLTLYGEPEYSQSNRSSEERDSDNFIIHTFQVNLEERRWKWGRSCDFYDRFE